MSNICVFFACIDSISSLFFYLCFSLLFYVCIHIYGLPWWLCSQDSACQCKRLRLDLGPGRSHGEGNGNPLQYSCLENPTERSPAGYSPWVCKKVGHDSVTKQYTCMHEWYVRVWRVLYDVSYIFLLVI